MIRRTTATSPWRGSDSTSCSGSTSGIPLEIPDEHESPGIAGEARKIHHARTRIADDAEDPVEILNKAMRDPAQNLPTLEIRTGVHRVWTPMDDSGR